MNTRRVIEGLEDGKHKHVWYLWAPDDICEFMDYSINPPKKVRVHMCQCGAREHTEVE